MSKVGKSFKEILERSNDFHELIMHEIYFIEHDRHKLLLMRNIRHK